MNLITPLRLPPAGGGVFGINLAEDEDASLLDGKLHEIFDIDKEISVQTKVDASTTFCQKFVALPYAKKIPVDDQSIGYNTSGKAFFKETPKFKVRMSVLQTVGSGVTAVVNWNTEDYDTTDDFDLGTDAYTASVSGYYQIDYQTRLNDMEGDALMTCFLRKNGTNLLASQVRSALDFDDPVCQISGLVFLNGDGDKIDFTIKNSDTAAHSMDFSNLTQYAHGHWISY